MTWTVIYELVPLAQSPLLDSAWHNIEKLMFSVSIQANKHNTFW